MKYFALTAAAAASTGAKKEAKTDRPVSLEGPQQCPGKQAGQSAPSQSRDLPSYDRDEHIAGDDPVL
jgi:hypothetical protein